MEIGCISCRKPRTDSICGVCQGEVCRKCRLFLEEASFPFAFELPAELKHSCYCGRCYDEHVQPFKAEYDAGVERAKGVIVLFKDSKSTVRLLRKSKQDTRVSGSPDRDKTILQLAFHAAKEGFNAVVDVEVASQKVRHFGWQTSTWSGRGVGADVRTYQDD